MVIVDWMLKRLHIIRDLVDKNNNSIANLYFTCFQAFAVF